MVGPEGVELGAQANQECIFGSGLLLARFEGSSLLRSYLDDLCVEICSSLLIVCFLLRADLMVAR